MQQSKRRLFSVFQLWVYTVSLLAISGVALGAMTGPGGLGNSPILSDGGSGTYYAPHDSGAESDPENLHYWKPTKDADHFAWGSVTPSTPGPLTVYYDFRDLGNVTSHNTYLKNTITGQQQARAIDAMNAWSAATGGKLVFALNTGAPASQIINIGTGNLEALGYSSGAGGTLGLGGGAFDDSVSGVHSISYGIAWQDSAEIWDTTIGNGNPSGTFDYFTVVAQEIGHALGLGHNPTTSHTSTHDRSIMNGGYTVAIAALSADDIVHITSIYGVTAVPLPAGVWLLGSGLVWLFYTFRTRRQTADISGQLAPA